MSIKIDYDEIKGNVQGLTDAAEACVAEEMDPEDTKTTVKDFLNNSELQGQAFENVRIQRYFEKGCMYSYPCLFGDWRNMGMEIL